MFNKVVLALLSFIFFTPYTHGIEIQVVTTNEPPIQYEHKGDFKGVAYEILTLMFKELEDTPIVKFLPWARAYKIAQEDQNTLIFSLFRTRERENKFKWVAPMFPLDTYFYKLKGRNDIQIRSIEDAKKYQIGVSRSSAAELFLNSRRFHNVQIVTSTEQNIGKLHLGRIDLLAGVPIGLEHRYKRLRVNFDSIEKVFHVKAISDDLYMAFSKTTTDDVVDRFQMALLKVKRSEVYEKILNKYGINDLRS